MDRKQIAGIVVVLVSILLVTEGFYFGGSLPSFGQPKSTNVSGVAIFNGTIRTYDPYLLLPLNTSPDILQQLRMRPDVKDVQNNSQAYVVDTDTRDDVFTVGQFLMKLNVTPYAIANIAANDVLQFNTSLGMQNASIPNGVVRVATEPLVDSDSVVTVSVIGVIADGQVVDIQSASIMLQNVELGMNATVASLDHETYSYVIPWENRTQLGNLSAYGNYSYNKVDTVIFTTPLSLDQVMAKKQFPYISYIDQGSASVDPSFSNATQLAINFADVNYTLPPSRLTIQTNQTPPIPFNSSVTYTYDLVLNQSGSAYVFPGGSFFVDTDHQLPINSTISLNISAVALGDKILAVRRVGLPS